MSLRWVPPTRMHRTGRWRRKEHGNEPTQLPRYGRRRGRDRDWTGETPVTYPEPAFEVTDKRFTGRQGNATLQRIWHGMGNDRALWCEGPVWMGDWGCLLWSDIPNHRVLRWTEDDGHVSVFQTESVYSNGHTRDNQGRLIDMEHDTR